MEKSITFNAWNNYKNDSSGKIISFYLLPAIKIYYGYSNPNEWVEEYIKSISIKVSFLLWEAQIEYYQFKHYSE